MGCWALCIWISTSKRLKIQHPVEIHAGVMTLPGCFHGAVGVGARQIGERNRARGSKRRLYATIFLRLFANIRTIPT